MDEWEHEVVDAQKADPRLIEQALTKLSAEERAALELASGDYSVEVAAEFFELPVERFRALLRRARRRLVQEYERLEKGALVVVGVLARAPAALRRRVHDGAEWVRLVPTAMEGLASQATTLVLVAGLGIGGGAFFDGSPSETPQREEQLALPAAVVVARLPITAVAPHAPVPTAAPRRITTPAPAAPVSVVAAPTTTTVPAPPSGRAVGVAVGPVSPAQPHNPDETTYGTEVTPPVPPPPEATDLGVSPGPIGVGVGYQCPPPDEQSLVLGVVCEVGG